MASERSAAFHALGDAVADLLVDVAPVFEGTLQLILFSPHEPGSHIETI